MDHQEETGKLKRTLQIYQRTIEALFSMQRSSSVLEQKLVTLQELICAIPSGPLFDEWNHRIAQWWKEYASLEKCSTSVPVKQNSALQLSPLSQVVDSSCSKNVVLLEMKHAIDQLNIVSSMSTIEILKKLFAFVQQARKLVPPSHRQDYQLLNEIFCMAFLRLPLESQKHFYHLYQIDEIRKTLPDLQRFLSEQLCKFDEVKHSIEALQIGAKQQFDQLPNVTDAANVNGLKQLLSLVRETLKAESVLYRSADYHSFLNTLFEYTLAKLPQPLQAQFTDEVFKPTEGRRLYQLRHFISSQINRQLQLSPAEEQLVSQTMASELNQLEDIQHEFDIDRIKKVLTVISKALYHQLNSTNQTDLFSIAFGKLADKLQADFGKLNKSKSLVNLRILLTSQLNVYYSNCASTKLAVLSSSSILQPFCNYCKSSGSHERAECPVLEQMICYRCFGKGHKANYCAQKKGQVTI